MKALLDKLQGEWDNYNDKGKKVFLDKLLAKYSKHNYYVLFGVLTPLQGDALQTIKASYKKLALMLHPDKSKDTVYETSAQELFKLVNEAYHTLSDSSKELTYRFEQGLNLNAPSNNPEKASEDKHDYQPDDIRFYRNSGYTVFTQTNNTSSSSSKKYHRDITINETISATSDDITIHGNVYGTVENMSGDIKITGNVYGRVTNISGDNIINGNVEKNGTVC